MQVVQSTISAMSQEMLRVLICNFHGNVEEDFEKKNHYEHTATTTATNATKTTMTVITTKAKVSSIKLSN